ncbi:glutathione S-transferase N-terminal domain-containing protein [Variovorax sp. OK605]|uniref:glutathione S-transferase N-terminal domain-containing protein n=1 Tax=Variovorax sp. OK605 TaxID=1855317 RepID=UPI00210A285D|nr:glutathione S-transferase N-terminal domain-containing protein [Variovorax sp. OK605]
MKLLASTMHHVHNVSQRNVIHRQEPIMKLFYSPGASSLPAHIVLREAGLRAELVRVDLENKTPPATGRSYLQVTAMGKVPALELDDGEVLTEGLAVLQYLADLAPSSQLAPLAGSMARHRLAEASSVIASELHKGFAPMFDLDVPASYKRKLITGARVFERIASMVRPGPYILGEGFTVADAYLYPILCLRRLAGLDFSAWPSIGAYMEVVTERPAVRAAMEAEGLAAD